MVKILMSILVGLFAAAFMALIELASIDAMIADGGYVPMTIWVEDSLNWGLLFLPIPPMVVGIFAGIISFCLGEGH